MESLSLSLNRQIHKPRGGVHIDCQAGPIAGMRLWETGIKGILQNILTPGYDGPCKLLPCALS